MAEAVERIGGSAIGFPGTPADPEIADALIDSCATEFGSVDILVNCAGTPEPAGSSILNVTSAQFRDLLDAHLLTTFETCRAAAPRMVATGSSAIVNTSSFAFLGDYGGTGYPAGKGGVNGLTLAIAAELREHGVRANVMCPGAKTRISTGPDYEAQIAGLNRRGLLDDVNAQGALDAPPPQHRADVCLPGERPREGHHRPDPHRRRRFRGSLRSADTEFPRLPRPRRLTAVVLGRVGRVHSKLSDA